MTHPGIPTGVHVLCETAGRILLMRRSGTGFFDGQYSLPGGHVEPGESVHQAAVREMREETGLRLREADLQFLGVVHRLSDTNRIDFFMLARDWTGDPVICEPTKCGHLAWFDRDALPEPVVPYVLAALGAGTGPWVIELGWAAEG